MNSLLFHWIFYIYVMFHIGCFILAIRIAEKKNLLTNTFFAIAVVVSPLMLIWVLLIANASNCSNQKISIYNYVFLAVVLVLLFFVVRIVPNIIWD